MFSCRVRLRRSDVQLDDTHIANWFPPIRLGRKWLINILVSVRPSSPSRFEIIRMYLHRSMLINELNCKHEAQAVILAYEGTFNTLHHAGFDANPLSEDKVPIWLDLL